MNSLEMMEAVEKLFEESDFSKFTIILQRKAKQNDLLITTSGYNRKSKPKYSRSYSNRNSEYSFRVNGHSDKVEAEEEDFDSNYATGLRLYAQGEYEEALELFIEEESELASSLKEGAVSVKQYHNICFQIGNCHYRNKDYEEAIEFFEKQFEGEDLKQKGQKFNNLGSCYAHLDKERLSLNYYTEAFKIYSHFPEVDCSNLLNNLGRLYAQSGVYDTAEKYFLESIEQRKSKSPENNYLMYCSYMQLGNCQKNAKKLNLSIDSFRNALRISEKGVGDESETLIQLACIHEMS